MASSSSEDFNIFGALCSQPDLLELVVQQCSGNKNNLRLACSGFRAAVDACVTGLVWTAPPSFADFIKEGKRAQNMEFLSRCPRLQALDFNGWRVLQALDLSPLAACINLRKVTGIRAYCYASGGSLAPLAALTNLEHLQVESTGSSDFNFSELTALAACTTLKHMDCSQAWIKQLPPLPVCLETLICHHAHLTYISAVSASTYLKYLDCSNSGITIIPALYDYITPAGLETLLIGGTRCADLSPLAACIGLRSLDCSHTPVRNLLPLMACARLEVLECSFFDSMDDQTNKLLQAFPGLVIRDGQGGGMWGEVVDEEEAYGDYGYEDEYGMGSLGWDDDSDE